MSKQLTHEDAQALDLLLERPDGHGDVPAINQIFAHPAQAVEQNISHVDRVFVLLDQFPAEEPPADLVQRTLRYVTRAAMQTTTALAPLNLMPIQTHRQV